MAREDHQPFEGAVERPQRSGEEKQEVCGRTIAFVLAFGKNADGSDPDVLAAIEAAKHARAAAAVVLAAPSMAETAAEAMRNVGRKGNTLVQAMEYDPTAAVPLTREAGNFELVGLPFGLLVTLRAVAESLLDDYEAVVVLDASQDRITSDHLFELCFDARAHAGTEAAASWIQWARRMPCWIGRAFLERLAAHDPTLVGEGVPYVKLRDHVFGEEKLAAAHAAPNAVLEFLGGRTCTALQAVRLAKYARERPGEELHSPNQARSLLAPAKPEPLCEADARLVDAACEVLTAVETLPAAEREELAWADEFGRRAALDFPLLNDRAHAGKLAYLDSAATGQRLGSALQAQSDFDAHGNANVYRGAYELSAQATFSFGDARTVLEEFIGAGYREVIFTQNTTAAANLVALAWGERSIGADDLIVCCLADHHSNALPFLMLAERKGARVEYVPYDAGGRLDQQAYAALLERRPKLVSIAHVGNVFGIMAPVREMADAAHAAGARVLVDAAQSFPHVSIDVSELGADWVAISAHKAYGPMGIGALWASPTAFNEMDPLAGGGGTVSHVGEQTYYLRPKAVQYEPGTPPVSQAIGWAAAIRYLQGLGMDNIARHDAALTRYAVRGLQRIDGVRVVGDHSRPDGRNGLVSFTVRSVAPADLATFLGKLDVAVRAGGHCALPLHAAMGVVGTGRISIGCHTTRDDIDAALAAIALCRELYES